MTTAVRAARLFDGWSWIDRPVEVVLSDGRIQAVGEPAPLADSVEVIDLGDATLLPGLVDAHTHLTWDASAEAVARVSSDDLDSLLEQARRASAAALAVGITTVRDLGDRAYIALQLRDEFRADPSAGPEIIASGPPVTIRGGHCSFLGGEAETTAELLHAVAERVEHGVDVIKVMATGGEVTPGGLQPFESQYMVEELTLVADAAHRAGMPVTAHAHGARGAIDAIRAGFDCIEHAGFWTETTAVLSAADLDELVARGTMVVSTPAGRGLFDPKLAPPRIAARMPAVQQVFTSMRAAGVPLAYASDAGISPIKPHDVLPYSLRRATASGLSCAEALRAMTSIAAQACGVGDRKGRVRAGCDADLLAVHGDPRDDNEALAQTCAVIRAGAVVSPPAQRATPPARRAATRRSPTHR